MQNQYLLPILVMAVFVFGAQQLSAQIAIGGGVQTSIPTGSFSDEFDGTPVGLGATFTAPLFKRSPLHIGFGFGWNRMGREEQDVYVSDVSAGPSSGDISITTNRYTYDFLLRLSPLRGRFQPFVEGVAGWSNFISKSDVNTEYANGQLGESSERLHNNMSWNYGWGAGIDFRLAPFVFLEGKVQRLYSTETSFINHETITIDSDGNSTYDMTETRPEFVTIQAGIVFKF